MTTSIKITALTDIASSIAYDSIIPIVDMSGTPVTDKANLQIVGNLFLSGAGGTRFAPAAVATIAGTVTGASQANITSVGTLTSLGVNGTITAVNITANTGVFTGDGGGLSNLSADTAVTAVSSVTALNASTVLTAAQPNITSTGTLTGLGVNGHITVTGSATAIGGGATTGISSILAISPTFGSSDPNDPSSAQGLRGRVTGADLGSAASFNHGVAGMYNVTGTNASLFPKVGVLGVIGDGTTTADAAVLAYMDGDSGVTTANAAFGVAMINTTAGSGFDYGVDLQFINTGVINATSPFKEGDIRLNNGIVIKSTTDALVDGDTTTLPPSSIVITSNAVGSGFLYISNGSTLREV